MFCSVILEVVLVLCLCAFVTIFTWALNRNQYWKRLGFPNVAGYPLIGNFFDVFMMRKCAAIMLDELYTHPNSKNQPAVGIHICHKPGLLLRDPELIKKIAIKDFNYFSNRNSASDARYDKLGSFNLFLARNPFWRQLRSRLTPMFSSSKMKQMFHLVNKCGMEMNEHLCASEVDKKTNSFQTEIREIASRFSTDVIATCAFGIEANCMKNPESEFRQNGRRVFHFNLKRSFEFNSIFFLPEAVSLFRMALFSQETCKFLRSAIGHAITEREKSGSTRNDLIDMLLTLKNDEKAMKESNLSEADYKGDMLVAQASVFFTAGYETSSSVMTFAMYEITKKPEIQKRLRKEILETLEKSNGAVTYENINSMAYLDMVINETLRMYPPLPFLDRICTPPPNEKGYSLQPDIDLNIPAGMPIIIPVYSIHRDPQFYPDPSTFDPERFAPDAVKQPFMPFGLGPHNCIGARFGLMQVKIGLVNFLRNHYTTLCDSTTKDIVLERRALMLQSDGGIELNVIRSAAV